MAPSSRPRVVRPHRSRRRPRRPSTTAPRACSAAIKSSGRRSWACSRFSSRGHCDPDRDVSTPVLAWPGPPESSVRGFRRGGHLSSIIQASRSPHEEMVFRRSFVVVHGRDVRYPERENEREEIPLRNIPLLIVVIPFATAPGVIPVHSIVLEMHCYSTPSWLVPLDRCD